MKRHLSSHKREPRCIALADAPTCKRSICQHRVKWDRSRKQFNTFCSATCGVRHAAETNAVNLGRQQQHEAFYQRLFVAVLGGPVQDVQTVTREQLRQIAAVAYKRGSRSQWMNDERRSAAYERRTA